MNYFKLKFLLLFFALAVAIPPAWAETVYELLTSNDQLKAGKTLIITSKRNSSGTADAMYQQQSNNFSTTTVSIKSDQTIVDTGEAQILTLEGATDAWHFKTIDNLYLYAASSSKNYLRSKAEIDPNGNSNAKIIINSTTGVSQIIFQGNYTHNRLKHNTQGIFSCYENGQEDVYIYIEKDGGDTPPAEENIYQKVTNASQLVADKTYIIVNESANVGMGDVDDNRYGTVVTGLEFADGKVNIGGTEVTELTLGGKKDAWTFMLPNSQYLAKGNNDNKFLLATSPTTNISKWKIDLSNGCSIINKDDSYPNYRYIRYENNRFEISYGSNVALYVKYEGGETPQPADVTLSFPENSYTATLGEAFTAPMLSVDPAGAASEVTYSSSNTGVAMVDESTGAITLVAAGTTTITASINDSETYNDVSDSYELTVLAGSQPGGHYYEKVTSTEDLTSGEYLIVCEKYNKAFKGSNEGATLNSNGVNLAVTIDKDNNRIEASVDVDASTFTIDTSAGTLRSKSGYYIGKTTNANGMDIDPNTQYTNTFSIDDSKNAIIASSGGPTLRYNGGDNDLFRYYKTTTTTVTAIQLYKKVESGSTTEKVATPTFSPAAGTYTEVQNVEINCTTDGATIYYTTDGDDPTTSSAVYSTAIEVAQNMTIKAMAVKEDMENSAVASATYTINLPITVSTLAAANALKDKTEFTFTENNVVVTFKGNYTSSNGNSHTLIGLRDKSENDKTDGTGKGGSVFYDISANIADNLTQGTVLNPGWKAKTSIYEGWTELVDASDITTAETTATVEPFDRTGVTLTKDNQSEYIILKNVTISGNTATAGTRATYSLYNRFGLEYGNGDYESLIGVVIIHGSAIEIYPLELKKAKVEAGLTYGEEPVAVTAKIGEDVTEPELTNPNNLTVTYSSSDTNVATVDAEGNVTAVGAGEATITASFAGNDNYLAGEASYTITVTKKDAGLKYEQAEFTVYAGNDFTAPTLVNPNKLSPITYSIEGNDPEIVLFDGENGTVVVGDKTGTVTITAKFAGNDTYNEATASYTLNIIEKEVATLSFDVKGITVYPNAEDFNQPKLTTSPENLTVTYTSTDDNIATVVDGVLMIGDKIGKATITATFAGNDEYAKAEASYTVTVEPRPIVVADEDVEFELYVGQTGTETFTVMAQNLKGDITLTLNDKTGFYRIEPTTIDMDDAENATVTVTYAPTTEGFHEATVTLSTKDAEENVTVTLTGMAEVQPVVAMPTFSLVAGSYTGPQQVTINCATKGATISYSTDGGSTWTVGNTVNVDKDMTIMAKAEKDGMTVSTTASATYVIITEEAPVTVNIKTGYYQIKNLGNGLYANVAGRKTLNFTDAPADKAGTVIYVDVENDGTVKSLRSQAADLQRYADRAMSYVPEVVKIVAKKLNADGSGEILGETGLGKILDKFNECFDHNLHVEQAEGGYRLYGKTPSMQPVVEFYRENKDKVEAKLPNLEAFINSALEKLKAKIGGSSVFTEFKLHDIWDKMGGTLTEPVDAASTMAFYREVLNNKNYVWDFAYQTAMIYVNNLMNHPRWSEVEEQLGEYAQYIDKIKQIRPEFKYYIVQKDGKPDFISEGNKDIIDNAERTIWTLEPRTDFTVNFPEANKHNGEYVTTLYTDFAYTLPEGVTAYAVTEVSTQGVATLTALEGTIPAQTPVLLKSTAYGAQTVTLSTEAGTAPADNLLVGPDYLIKTYEIKTPQVEKIFEIIQNKLPGFYEEYVAQYEYLMLKTAGTVGNKYFWGLNKDEIIFDNNCVVRSLDVQDGTVAFYDNATVSTNKAFLVDDANNPQDVIKLSLRGDINKDGVISIIDVTALIDILLDLPDWNYLKPTTSYPKGLDYEAADVNEKDGIEINDVTALIDILLNMPDQPAQGSGN